MGRHSLSQEEAVGFSIEGILIFKLPGTRSVDSKNEV
jgi:hypothetical protein